MKKACFILLLVMILFTCSVHPAYAADPVPVEKIVLSETAVNLPVNKSFTLKATFEPKNPSNKKLEWSSSDENIATVRNGQVRGVNPGTATITATALDGSNVSASAQITVVIPVKKITLSEGNQLPLAQYVSWKVTAVVEPYEATMLDLEWSSSNEKVAIVDQNGVITGLEPGTAKITAAAKDGSKAKASLNVKVSEYDVVFTSKSSQSVTYSYGSGYILVDGFVKTGCVSIPNIETSILCLIGKDTRTESVSVKPVKPGPDVVTIKVNSKKFIYNVFVSPEAFPTSSAASQEKESAEGEIAEILFMDVPWGSSYPEAQKILKTQNITIKPLMKNNDQLRAIIGGDIPFMNVTAFRAAMNFSYDINEPDYEKKNALISGNYYFESEIPFEQIKIAARNAYGLDKGTESKDKCTWQRGDVSIVLTKKEKYSILEIVK